MKNIAALSLMLVNVPAIAGVTGYAWSDCGSASCTPSSAYQYNSSGGVNEVTRNSAGSYTVRMPGIASSGGNAQVSAYGTNGHCQIENWYPSGSDQYVNVACFDAAGTRADSLFDVLFFDQGAWTTTSRRESAYVWAEQPSAVAAYRPSSSYRYSSTNRRITVTKVYTGTYDVYFPNMRTRGIVPVVSSYGSSPSRCAALDWFAQGTGLTVRVECNDVAGSLLDTYFSLAIAAGAPAGADSGADFQGAGIAVDGFGVVDTTSSFYDVPGFTDADVSVAALGTGYYEVTLPGLADYYDTFIVTAQPGAIGTRCNVGGWFPSGSDTHVIVDCYNAAGSATNAAFVLLWQTSSP